MDFNAKVTEVESTESKCLMNTLPNSYYLYS